MSIETDELITILTKLPPIQHPPRPSLLGALLLAAALTSTVFWLGLRPDLTLWSASFWFKTSLLMVVAIFAMRALIASAAPLSKQENPFLLLILVAGVATLVISEWLTNDREHILSSFLLPNFVGCLRYVSLYGSVGMVGLTLLLSRYAPANPTRCAGYIGLAGAALGALGYSLHCPIDSPTFVVVAYGLPILCLWFLGRLFLPPLLRW